jgi:hypothetical protein
VDSCNRFTMQNSEVVADIIIVDKICILVTSYSSACLSKQFPLLSNVNVIIIIIIIVILIYFKVQALTNKGNMAQVGSNRMSKCKPHVSTLDDQVSFYF